MAKKKSWQRELIEDIVVIALALVIFWGSGIALQLYLGTPTPFLAVESESMEPTLYRGDLIILQSVDPNTLQVGDIIVFDFGSLDVPVVHRIIHIENTSGYLEFTTMGDNNPGPDPEERIAGDIHGKVIGSVRYFGYVTLLLLLPGGIVTIFLIIMFFVLLSFLCDSFTKKPDSEEVEENHLSKPD
jgi:signal peptidase